ncbi:bifunctional diaminohydroxyphosphoribosylaminopyrimidine deaminase/5-amino-6-(5-phosphoribosylamino)uracil reductase RibD [Ferruginibacter sp. SUN106]|uniref:bifunctional diaminohydroxyphosphoribosylaminopyrimidine deaminase/5-amino-6-(5-phosphoribosylamino)uracil reductase RibD n=1 Tax=Ferruginibacter sp. SUN106 TaxID=2978348 RepID=UPI003D35C18B
MTDNEKYIYRCLQLARLGAGLVAPNPMVGAVLVYENKIIGEGYHQQYGQAHAEVNCINSVAAEEQVYIEKSTLFVSLEPCAHFGKTPPCADLIIKNKIRNVVIGCRDSYTEVDGKGIAKLKAAGINVTVGVLQREALDLNKRFFTFHQQQRPYIILKWAQTKDEQIAGKDGLPLHISNEFTNRLVHQWRSEEAAIMVGTNTALKDDPALTTRLYPGKNPLRIVIDMELKLPASLQLFDNTVKTIVFNAEKQSESEMLSFYQLNKNEQIIPQILKVLYSLKIQSVIIEGGTRLLQSFIDDNFWDEARIITNAEMTIGEGILAPLLRHQKLLQEEIILTDKINYFTNTKQ